MDSISWQEKDKVSKSKRKPRVQQSYDDDFQQDNATVKKPSKQIDLPKIAKDVVNQSISKIKQDIKEENEDDAYGDDFQQSSNKKLPQPQKISTKINNNSQKFSPQVNSKDRKPYEEFDEDGINDKAAKKAVNKNSKPQTSPPLNVKKKSVSSSHLKRPQNPAEVLTKKPSQSVMKNNSIQLQSKYMGYFKTEFPHTKEEVLKFPPQKINRLNEKLRSYIKRVNDELTDLINENMRLIKLGSLQSKTQGKSVEATIKVLTQQKKNGETYIDTIQKQCYNLSEQWNKIRDGEAERVTDQDIKQITHKIKENTKEISILKFDMKTDGNKLNQENDYAEKIGELKSKFAIIKKQEERLAEKLQKFDKNFQELTQKTPQIDAQLEKLLETAKQQKITLNFNPSDKKKQQKYEELKKKAQNIRLHKEKTQGLCESKTAVLRKDIETLSTEITQTEKRFQQLEVQLHSTQESSISLIEESKRKDLEPYVQTHLDFIYKNIKQGNPMTTITLLKPSKNSQEKGIKRDTSSVNMKGFVRSQSDAELKPSFHITKKSPLEMKTKQKVALKLKEREEKTVQQRVWKNQNQAELEHQKEADEVNSSKPFVIRRSLNVSSPSIQSLRKQSDLSIKQGEQKENEKNPSILGPRKSFKKTDHTETQPEKNKQSVITEKNANSPQEHIQEQESHSKPLFKIKKAVKQIVNIPDQELYPFSNGNDKTERNNEKKGQQKNGEAKQSKIPETEKSQPVSEQGGLNIGGRRQIQRKIQRKNEDSYVG